MTDVDEDEFEEDGAVTAEPSEWDDADDAQDDDAFEDEADDDD
jgi:hypothetical protein